jgi:nucleoside-diphosphate-sugar epimerase
MQVFVTGATGFVGARVVSELVAAGHQVLGLTRSEAGARALAAANAQAHFGELSDLSTLRAGAAKADAVIHTAFDHDFSRFAANCEQDRRVIEALGDELKGSGRPLIVTSGVGMGEGPPGELAVETRFNPEHRNPRVASELAATALLDRGVDVRVVRLPQVHDTRKQGLISYLIAISREQGVAAYLGEGQNRWSAVHVDDAASLYRLALERGQSGALSRSG